MEEGGFSHGVGRVGCGIGGGGRNGMGWDGI